MENGRMSGPGEPPPSPLVSPSLLRDVSNIKTPRPSPHSVGNQPSPSPLFFTASKATPSSARPSSTAYAFRRRSSLVPLSHSKAARRLKALELEQSRSARKALVRREKCLRSFSRSLSSWLNFLFVNPASCGCNVDAPQWNGGYGLVSGCGKRGSLEGGRKSAGDEAYRWPKRQRGVSCKNSETVVAPLHFSSLRISLKDVCSFEDLVERMNAHLSEGSCQEVLSTMSRVAKNIDEGRLKMKLHCPLVTDVGLKEKATKVLMSYNPSWLRVGLHIIFGGDSLLHSEEGASVSGDNFIKLFIERQFFSHAGLAKSYAYSKLVEGVYRPGYFEALGNVILKRFLLLVLLLDKAKCDSALPVKYGIDGVDGGSPLLFCCQSHIKSSQQVIREFLSEVMHGEGDLYAHLVILGCKVSHQQLGLAEYNFHTTNLFEDLQDGVLLCRIVQLLKSDASVLSKMMTPPNTQKKKIHNCNLALQYLKLAGVPLSDEDGVQVVAEDVACGDRLILALLWNIFIHLQVPLLISKSVLIEEIAKVKRCHMDLSKCNRYSHMELLLEWVQAITESYNITVDGFSSLVDGKALNCLVRYYVRHQVLEDIYNDETIPLLDCQNTVAVNNVLLVQQVLTTLGRFPKVLQVSDILDEDASYDERSVIILLVFLASHLLLKQGMIPNGKALATSESLECWNISLSSPVIPVLKTNSNMKDNAATLIQAHFRRLLARKRFLKVKESTETLKGAMRGWLAATKSTPVTSDICQKFYLFMYDRQAFVTTTKSVRIIQMAVRAWMVKRKKRAKASAMETSPDVVCEQMEKSACGLWHTQIQKDEAFYDASDGQEVALAQREEGNRGNLLENTNYSRQHAAAVIIQSRWRCWSTKRMFLCQIRAVLKIQSSLRSYNSRKSFVRLRLATVVIQKVIRGQTTRNRLLGASCHRSSKSRFESSSVINGQIPQFKELKKIIGSIEKLQKWWKQVLLLKAKTRSATIIQSCIRGFSCRRKAKRVWRSIVVIQRWWRNVLALRERSALAIQSHVRGWIVRREAARERHRITVIQAYWKGYIVRKCERKQIFDIRSRIQKSAANVEDDMRLINRHLSALSLLLSQKSISNIRHCCSTLNTATEHSERCCKMLVDAGAIDILLMEVQKLTRSVPDQEVLKQILSILSNIARFPSLALKIISSHRSLEVIFLEFLRNKTDAYFLASELLIKLCAMDQGREIARDLQHHIKRLRTLIQELERKVDLHKRSTRIGTVRADSEQRLQAAVAVLQSTLGQQH